MKKRLITWFIYLSGCIACYLLTKYNMQHNIILKTRPYSITDRTVNIIISTGSWAGVAAMGIVYVLQNTDGDKPAKW